MKRISIGFLLLISIFSCQSSEEIEYEQYLVNGERIYNENCANCHQKDGKGLSSLYPPLLNSEYLNDQQKVICIIRNGQIGPITVAGKQYDQRMPGFSKLYEIDLAQLLTFMQKEFAQNEQKISPDEVKKNLNNCSVLNR